MKTIYEAGDDEEVQDVVFTLDVSCQTDDTLNVTSDDLVLDPGYPRTFVFLFFFVFFF